MDKSKESRKIYVALGCVLRDVSLEHQDTSSQKRNSAYQVLLTRRREKDLPELDRMWELPGGKIEPNETANRTVEREILEETGYRVSAISPLERVYVVVREYPSFKQETIITCYECRLLETERQEVRFDAKIDDVKWSDLNDVDYIKTLAGSREFLVDLTKRIGIKIDPGIEKRTSNAQFRVPLNTEDKSKTVKKRKGRRYTVSLQIDADVKNYYLITYRGGVFRLGWEPKIEIFDNNESLMDKAKDRISTRFHHGYILARYDDDFPLIEWIKKRKYPIVLEEGSQDSIQLMLPLFDDEDNEP